MKFSRDLIPEIDAVRTRQRPAFPEIESDLFWELYQEASHYSLLHVTGFYNVFQVFEYLAKNSIKGDIVECGCFLGGMALFMGRLKNHYNLTNRIVLFDTFEGPPVGSSDVVFGNNIDTPGLLPHFRQNVEELLRRADPTLDGYSLVEGLVEDTLPAFKAGPVAILRLDTDFYSSTKVELETLYPWLVPGGALIVDDYGLFQGARKATDEYFARLKNPPLLNRIDQGVWAGVKPG